MNTLLGGVEDGNFPGHIAHEAMCIENIRLRAHALTRYAKRIVNGRRKGLRKSRNLEANIGSLVVEACLLGESRYDAP